MKHAEDVTEMQIQASGPNPEESALDHADRALMRRMIDALPEDLRQPLMLSAIEEMRSHQVAAILGIPEGTVRTRVMNVEVNFQIF